MDGRLPQTMGHEAAGVVDELGEGVVDVAVGDRVFGLSAEGAAQAEPGPLLGERVHRVVVRMRAAAAPRTAQRERVDQKRACPGRKLR
jgi:NADPH:quinone reductase-like Zn-dependent oxidoreductase